MKDLIICKDPITGKFVSGYKIIIKAKDFKEIYGKSNTPFTFTYEPNYIDKNFFNALIYGIK